MQKSLGCELREAGELVAALHALWEVDEQRRMTSCLCISGSVARGEGTAFSDLDLLVLVDENHRTHEAILGGVAAVHSLVRSASIVLRAVDECRAMRTEDARSWLSLLELRAVAGDARLLAALRNALAEDIHQHAAAVLASCVHMTRERHQQYGASSSLLEPNVKNSAGGLRDIHMLCYMERVHRIAETAAAVHEDFDPASSIARSSLMEARKQRLLEARSFLLQLRCALHEAAGHLHDTLEFDRQEAVTAKLSSRNEDVPATVEEFMKIFHQHSREIRLALLLATQDYAGEYLGGSGVGGGIPMFHLPAPQPQCGEDVLEMFALACEHGALPGSDVLRHGDAMSQFDYSSERCSMLFDAILRSPRHVARTLRALHECGVLGRVLPDFAALHHFFQHNIYHYYTADEHTLNTIEAAEALTDDTSVFGSAYRSIKDTSVLYYALLFHDIAKPRDVARHEMLGAETARSELYRLGRADIADDVEFLVRQHLRLEQVAFRRNIRDASILAEMRELVGTVERLRLLFVLTYADMSALNPTVFTEWKKDLLAELFRNLEDSLLVPGDGQRETDASASNTGASVISRRRIDAAVEDVREGEPMRVFTEQRRAHTDAVILCMDRPNVLAQLSAAILGADANIVDASIETRRDVVIDRFRLVDIVSGSCLSNEQVQRLRDMVLAVCTLRMPAEDVYQRSRRKWQRRLRRLLRSDLPVEVKYIDQEGSEQGTSTIIEVYTPDTFGLLYTVAHAISSFGLNIVFAKIATRVDGVVDSFYVQEPSGQAFVDAHRRELLRKVLLQDITRATQTP